MDLGLLAAAGFAAGAWEGPWAFAGLLAGGIALPRLGLAHRKTMRRRQTLRRLIAERRTRRQAPPAPPHPLTGLGDELKTPLNAIIGYASLLGDEPHGPLSPAHGEYVRSIAAASRNLKGLVDAVLDLERIRARGLQLQEQETDAAELAEVAVRLCQPEARAAGVLVTFDSPPARLEIRGDTARLQQALTNLLLAAIAATPKANTVRVSIRATQAAGLSFAVETGGTATFPEDITLSLAQALVRLHGGALHLEPGRAELCLPASRVKPG